MGQSILKTVYSDDYARFLNRLIEARKNARLTQQQLANVLCKPQSFISKYERRERRLDVVEFVAICSAVGCDPIALLKDAALWPRAANFRHGTKKKSHER